MCIDSLRHLIHLCSSLSTIYIWLRTAFWIHLPLYTQSSMPDFVVSLLITYFRCFASLTFIEPLASPSYFRRITLSGSWAHLLPNSGDLVWEDMIRNIQYPQNWTIIGQTVNIHITWWMLVLSRTLKRLLAQKLPPHLKLYLCIRSIAKDVLGIFGPLTFQKIPYFYCCALISKRLDHTKNGSLLPHLGWDCQYPTCLSSYMALWVMYYFPRYNAFP